MLSHDHEKIGIEHILAPQVFYENINWNYFWNADDFKTHMIILHPVRKTDSLLLDS